MRGLPRAADDSPSATEDRGEGETRAIRFCPVPNLGRFQKENALVVGLLGAIVAGGVYFADAPGWRGDGVPEFVKTPQFYYWLLLHLAQGALWFVLAIPLAVWLRELWRFWNGEVIRILAAAGALLAVIGAFVYFSAQYEIDYEFPWMALKIGLLAPFPILLALGGAIGVWLVDAGLRREEGTWPTRDAIAQFIYLRDRSTNLLLLLAALLSASILNLVVLRSAVLAAHGGSGTEDVFPKELVLLHGTFFSILLAFGYGPTFLRARARAREMREQLFDVPSGEEASWSHWHAERDAFDKVMELQPESNPTVRAIAGILSPAATGLLPFLG